jgi:hypothetical protein
MYARSLDGYVFRDGCSVAARVDRAGVPCSAASDVPGLTPGGASPAPTKEA